MIASMPLALRTVTLHDVQRSAWGHTPQCHTYAPWAVGPQATHGPCPGAETAWGCLVIGWLPGRLGSASRAHVPFDPRLCRRRPHNTIPMWLSPALQLDDVVAMTLRPDVRQ